MAYKNELTIGALIARKAGDLALEIREGNIGIESKSDESPVTIADKACEALIARELSEAFPGDGQMGEEGASRESANGRRWIIDPIDGTRDFIRGTGAWSVLIGLEENGIVVAGFAYFPTTGTLYSAALGEGAWRERGGKTERIAAKNPGNTGRSATLLQWSRLHAPVRFCAPAARLDFRILDRPQHGRLP